MPDFFKKKENIKFIIFILMILAFLSYLLFYFYDNYLNFETISNEKISEVVQDGKKLSPIEEEFRYEYIDEIEYTISDNAVFYRGISFDKGNGEFKRNFRFVLSKKESARINEFLKNGIKKEKGAIVFLGKDGEPPKMFQNTYRGPNFFSILEFLILVYAIHSYLAFYRGNGKIISEKSNIFFKDIAGYEEEKKEMKKIVSYLKKPEIFDSIGAKLPKGVLFSGSPGTGKTLLAKAIANEAKVPFYYASGSEFEEMLVGLGASRIRKLFSSARENAPCVIFIDEIDSVGRARDNVNNLTDQTLNQLLVEMDGFKENSGIIVIAATNRIDTLDKALIRSGRFDKIIFIPLPSKNDREKIFKIHSRNKRIAADVDFEELSSLTIGLSGADIENIMNEAAILAINNKNKEITLSNINEAIDRKILGLAKKSLIISKKEKEMIAFHESGHAIIGLSLSSSDKVQKISIISRAQTGGHVLMSQKDDKILYTKEEMFSRIVGYLGGRASEEIFFGKDNISSGASNDIEMSTYLAHLMVVNFGMSSLGPIKYEKNPFFADKNNFNFSEQTAYEIDQEIKKTVDSAYTKALSIINERKEDVKLIAETLLEKETITFKQIECLLKNKENKLKKEKIKESKKVENEKNK